MLSEGIIAAGIDVVDGGVLTTPAVQALCRDEGFASAIVVSASHNPAEDNGIKVLGSDGRKLADDLEVELEGLIDADAPLKATTPGRLTKDADAENRYVHFMHESCFPALDLRGRTIILDCAHGAASHLGPRLLDAFHARSFVFHAQPDGLNINRNVGVFHVADLKDAVVENAPAIGVALDGDADRALFLDENGVVRDGDHIMGLLADDLARRHQLPGRLVVTTVMANLGLTTYLKRHTIQQETVPVGDRYVSARMAETGATLGGEQSGHIIFRSGTRWFGDGLYTALRVLDVMVRSGKSLAELAAGIEKFPQVLINVKVATKPPVTEIPGLSAAHAAAEKELADEGRIVLRYSGTESILRVMVEGRHEELVKRIANDLADIVRRAIG